MVMTDVLAVVMMMTGVYLSPTQKYGMADCPYMSSNDVCYCDLILMMPDVLPMVMREVSFLVNKVLALEMMLMSRMYLSSTQKYGMADCLHRMSNYSQTPSLLALVAAAAAAIQVLSP
jgi:hypothetical protein